MTKTRFELRPASTFSLSQLADLLTAAYADYAMPVYVNADLLKGMVHKWDILLDKSPVAVVEGQPVGLALLAQRETRGWVSSVGVLPSHRRRGITLAMLGHLQRQARELGLRTLHLDVLDTNTGAIALYQRVGFIPRGRALTFQKTLFAAKPAPFPLMPVVPVDAEFALAFHTALPHTRPPWVRELASLRNLCAYGLHAFGYFEHHALKGYVLYTPGLNIHDIYDLTVDAMHPQHDALVFSLLHAVETLYDLNRVYLISVAEEDPLLPLYCQAGYELFYQEYEMCWSVFHEEETP